MLKTPIRQLFCDMARVVERQRKRKMDSHLQSVSGDNTSVCAKSSKVCKSRRTVDQFYPSGHVSTVFLGDVVPKFKSKYRCAPAGDNMAPSTSSSSSSAASSSQSSFKEFRFECKLGDIWQERYTPTPGHVKGRRKVKVSTGDYEFDIVATRLLQEGNFTTRELLSRGKFSSVVLASSTEHNRDVVIKYMKDKSPANPKRLMCCSSPFLSDPDEVKLLRQLSHPNVVQMLDFRSINNTHILTLEFCENGNLEGLLQSIPNGLLCEHLSRKYLLDITAGIEYLHSQSVAHCGITGQHILLDRRNRARICGFGSAVRYSAAKEEPITSQELIPVTAYQAPEVILKQPILDPRKLDVWAVGILLYRMATGNFIFGQNIKKIPVKSVRGPRVDRSTYFLSELFHGFLEHVLTHSSLDRPSIYLTRQLGWMTVREKKLRIGYHYLVSHPARGLMSTAEKQMKEAHGI